MAGGGITEITLLRAYHFELTALWRGEMFENHGLGATTAADMADAIYAHSPAAGERFEIQTGFNDMDAYGVGTAALGVFSSAVAAQALWLAGNKSAATAVDWSFTGSWFTTDSTPGKYTDAAGATASGSFTGDVLHLGYTVSSITTAVGRFSLSVDGISRGTFDCGVGSSTQRHADTNSYAPAVLRLAGFGAGSHTFVITTLDAKRVFIDWVGRGANGVLCSILSLPKCTAFGYAKDGANCTAANIDTMNAALSALVTQAVADGYDLQYIDINAGFDPDTMTIASGASQGDHPNNLGGVQWTKTKLAALP